MSLKRIRLDLARDPDFPMGSAQHGYEFTAPLDDNAHIDPNEWKKKRDMCRVRRFWGNEDDEIGHLVRRPGGSWAFHYDLLGDEDDDESGYRFAIHSFRPGEYVTIKEHDDTLKTFRVVTVEDFPA